MPSSKPSPPRQISVGWANFRAAIVGTIVLALIAVFGIWLSHRDVTHEAKPAPPITAATSGPQTVTASGGGTATNSPVNNAAGGQGSQAGNANQGGSGNAQGAGSSVISGGAPVTNTTNLAGKNIVINVNGGTVNLNMSPDKQVTASGPPDKQKAIRLYNGGNVLIRAHKFQEASRQYRHVIELDPTLADALNNAAIADYEAGNYDDAFAAWRRAIRSAPENRSYRTNFANAVGRYVSIDPEAAVPLLKETIQQTIDTLKRTNLTLLQSSDLWNGVAQEWMQIGSIEHTDLAFNNAFSANETAIRYDPYFADVFVTRAAIRTERDGIAGEAAAMRDLKYAEILDPKDPEPYFFLAQYYGFKKNDKEQCYVNLRQTLLLDPTYYFFLKGTNSRWLVFKDDPRFRSLILKARNMKHNFPAR